MSLCPQAWLAKVQGRGIPADPNMFDRSVYVSDWDLLEVGIDVSARELMVAASRDRQLLGRCSFENTAEGRAALCRWLGSRGKTVRVCLEATGIYGLELCLALER